MHTCRMDKGGIGQRLKIARVAKKMSRTTLAKIVHKAYTTIAAYETGIAKPSYATLQKAAPELGVNLSWLAFGTGKQTPDEDGDEPEGLDRDIMTQVIREYERTRRRERVPDKPEEVAQLLILVHDISRKEGGIQAVREVLIRILKGKRKE